MHLNPDLPSSMPMFECAPLPCENGSAVLETSSIMGNATTMNNNSSLESVVDLVIKRPTKSTTGNPPPQIAKPKRPLTAYNLFFRSERAKMVGASETDNNGNHNGNKRRRRRKTNLKIGFQEMAKVVGQRWKQLDAPTRAEFQAAAGEDLKRYRKDMEIYRQTMHIMGLNNRQVVNQKSSSNKMFLPPTSASSSKTAFTDNPSFDQGQLLPSATVQSSGNLAKILGTPSAGTNKPIGRREILQEALAICHTNGEEGLKYFPESIGKCRLQADLDNDLRATFDHDINQDDINNLLADISESDGNTMDDLGLPLNHERRFFDAQHELDFEPIDLSIADNFEDKRFFETLGEDNNSVYENESMKRRRLNKFDNSSATEGLWDLLAV